LLRRYGTGFYEYLGAPEKFRLNSQRLFPTIEPCGCPGKSRKKSSKTVKPAEIEAFPKAGFIA